MSTLLPSVEQITSLVSTLPLPALGKTLGALKAVDRVDQSKDGSITVSLVFAFPVGHIDADIAQQVATAVQAVEGVGHVTVDIDWHVEAPERNQVLTGLEQVKHIVAVASGKGGVGKSTTSVNLALALSAMGAKVGLMDADIYGPSVPQMVGAANQRPAVSEQVMAPVPALGLATNSMGYLVTENTPMVWRGPMASGALQQILTQTQWGELDYLIIDMPPGTGDIQLTLSQKVPLSGAVIVTTPQDIALLDAKKAVEMFRKVNVPVLGVVENMATHICSNCGHEEHIFGSGGGERIAQAYQTQLLGSLPLDLSIQRQADAGHPTVVSEPDSSIAGMYRQIGLRVTAELAQQIQMVPHIEMGD